MLVLIVLITLALRLPYILRSPFLSHDEAFLAAAAERMLSGELLYRGVISDKPPLLHVLYYLVARGLGPFNLRAVQFISLGASLAAAFLIYRLAAYCWGTRCGCLSAFLYALFSTTFHPPEMIAANREIFLIVPYVAGAGLYLRGEEGGRRIRTVLAGALCGLAALFKQPGIALLGAVALTEAVLLFRRRSSPRQAIGSLAAFSLGAALAAGACGAFFARRGTLGEMWFWAYRYGWRYTAAVPLGVALGRAAKMAAGLFPPNALFWALVVVSLPHLSSLRRKVFFIAWVALSLAAAAAGRRAYPHYYIQAIAPAAILAGRGLDIAWACLRRRTTARRAGRIVWLATGAGALAAIALSHGPYIPRLLRPDRLYRQDRAIADYLRSHSRPDDGVFVWGFSPGIYLLARRHCAARFIVADIPAGVIPGRAFRETALPLPGALEMLIGDLEAERPLFIVDASQTPRLDGLYLDHPPEAYPAVLDLLRRGYRPVLYREGIVVYRRMGDPRAI